MGDITMMYLGIDGGGSNLRAAIIDQNVTPIAELKIARTVNPSSVGREAAATLLQEVITGVLSQANINAEQVAAVGIGVAGADSSHASDWLTDVLRPVLPTTHLALSNDIEIALVGANGARFGIMLLAGTGSAAYAVNAVGNSRMFGGWGYLTGDDGGGYWMGREAIRRITDADDYDDFCTHADRPLVRRIFAAMNIQKPRDIIPWLYATQPPRTRDVAALTDAVFAAYRDGDKAAENIIEKASNRLVELVNNAQRLLDIPAGHVAFGGGLLQSETPLQATVCAMLDLSTPPTPKYPAVIGAALLAKFSVE
jgi:N-acetylglucosamine kinase-like BadF-type ATPase